MLYEFKMITINLYVFENNIFLIFGAHFLDLVIILGQLNNSYKVGPIGSLYLPR